MKFTILDRNFGRIWVDYLLCLYIFCIDFVTQLSTCHVQVGGIRKLAEMLSVHPRYKPRPSTAAAAAAAADDDVDDDGDDGHGRGGDDGAHGVDGDLAGGQMSAEIESQLLRTLATLCCVEESLVQLHEVICICIVIVIVNGSVYGAVIMALPL